MTTDLKAKTFMVTGPTSGLGKATAQILANQGATVIMACRNKARGEAALAEIKNTSGNNSLEMLLVDLSSQESVYKAAQQFQQNYGRLDVLINNAAIFKKQRTLTVDSLETMFATNHLGPFLLTNLLLGPLKKSNSARIINISAPATNHLNFEDLQGEVKFQALNAFGASKMANLLFTFQLARQLEGTGVTCNVLHPGLVKSTLLGEMPAIMRGLLNLVSAPPEKAAPAVVYLATSPEIEGQSGKFFKGSKVIEAAAYAQNPQMQQALWEASLKLVGKFYRPD